MFWLGIMPVILRRSMMDKVNGDVRFPMLPALRIDGPERWEVSVRIAGGGVTLCPDGLYLEKDRCYEFVPASVLFAGLGERSATLIGGSSVW